MFTFTIMSLHHYLVSLSDGDRVYKSASERLKGNEAFRASDYEEALSYYTRALTLDETNISIYNNRSQTCK